METIRFKEISAYLSHGRELEFTINEKNYYVVNFKGYWYLGCDNVNLKTLCAFDDKDTLIKEVGEFWIDGKKLKDIFDELEYVQKSLYIF